MPATTMGTEERPPVVGTEATRGIDGYVGGGGEGFKGTMERERKRICRTSMELLSNAIRRMRNGG